MARKKTHKLKNSENDSQNLQVEFQAKYESGNPILTEKIFRSFFDENEIYQYTINLTQEYKEFKEEVLNHLEFLKKECEIGIIKNNAEEYTKIINYITSFLNRSHLINNNLK